VSQFQYFMPGASAVNQQRMADVGLGYLPAVSGGADIIGPEQIRGRLFAKNMELVRFDREHQTWIGAPKGDADSHPYWVGWDKESPPAPEDLARANMLAGDTITTVGGHRWQVPKIRDWFPAESTEQLPAWSTRLPRMVTVDDYGKPAFGEVVRDFRGLFDLSMRVFIRRISGEESGLSNADMLQFAADVLAMNYHISLFELSGRVLDCLSVSDAMAIIDCATDVDGYLDAVKNGAGRPSEHDSDTDSGFGRPTQDSETITAPLSAS